MRALTANEYERLMYLEGIASGQSRGWWPIDSQETRAVESLTEQGFAVIGRTYKLDKRHTTEYNITATGEKALRIHREYLKGNIS